MGNEIWFLPPDSAAGLGTACLLALHAFALFDALIRPPASFVAAGKRTKQLWVSLLALAVGTTLLLSQVTYTFVLAGTVASLVYILDVRPAVQTFRGRGGGGRAPKNRGGW